MPTVYITGSWSDGLSGVFRDVLERLRSAGIDTYDWTSAEHRSMPLEEQSAAIWQFLDTANMFVLVIGRSDAHMSSSCAQLGFALGRCKRIVIVDPAHGRHASVEDGGCGGRNGHHISYANIHGVAAVSTGQIRIVDTLEEAEAHLRRTLLC